MRKQRQPITVAVRQIQVVVDDTAVAVHPRRCARDVSHTVQDERNRAGRDDGVLEIIEAEAYTLQRKTAHVEKRRQITRVVE